MDMQITETAEKFIRRMLRLGGAPGAGFRLIMTAEGCSGLAGEFSIESQPQAGDAVVEYKGLRLFLPAASRLLLAGVSIDFADTPTQTGLVFHDPKKVGCGCSTGSESPLPQVASVSLTQIVKRS